MPRRIRCAKFETRTARLKLPIAKRPHDFTEISPGISLGYRRCKGAGRWVARVADGHGGSWEKTFAYADDYEAADGEHVLDFWQATDKARELARGNDDTDSSRPGTVEEAIADYEKDLIARNGSKANARRAKAILTSTLLSKPVALLTMRELKHLRDARVAKGDKPASINRDMKGLKAALTLYAKGDKRVTNHDAWKDGLAALTDAYHARDAYLADDQVLALVAAIYAEDPAFGLLAEVDAVTGARPSQLARLVVGDFEPDHRDGPRLQMPSSKKGKGVKRITHYPVPIPASIATKLRVATGDRPKSARLLLQSDGTAWDFECPTHREALQRAVKAAGLPPEVTLYWLRHSSIARDLLKGVPVRLVAVKHDTSIAMIERTYSKYLAGPGDPQLRRAMLDITTPTADNVVALSGRRS
jgi:integrase